MILDETRFEECVLKLASLLSRDDIKYALETLDPRHGNAMRAARTMVAAQELLGACELAFGVMTTMSTDQFAKAGDAVARRTLARAITWAGGSTEVTRRMQDIQATIIESVRRNAG
jgi:hypothetical protein